MNPIELFKTNVNERGAAECIIRLLQQTFPACRTTIDLHDCDKVLRLEGAMIKPDIVKKLVQQNGFLCCELE